MHDGIDSEVVQQFRYELPIADVADDEFRTDYGFAKTGAQVIKHDNPFTRLNQLEYYMTADIARAASDQDDVIALMLLVHYRPRESLFNQKYTQTSTYTVISDRT
jgi:hypothetical protein